MSWVVLASWVPEFNATLYLTERENENNLNENNLTIFSRVGMEPTTIIVRNSPIAATASFYFFCQSDAHKLRHGGL